MVSWIFTYTSGGQGSSTNMVVVISFCARSSLSMQARATESVYGETSRSSIWAASLNDDVYGSFGGFGSFAGLGGAGSLAGFGLCAASNSRTRVLSMFALGSHESKSVAQPTHETRYSIRLPFSRFLSNLETSQASESLL